MFDVMHHRHIRERIYKNLEPFPHPDSFKRALDLMVYVAGVLGPIFGIPQIYTIYVHKNAAGVSAFSWGMFALFNIVWILYGIVHRERVITVTYSLWFVVNSLVAIGAIIYGVR